MSKEQVGAGEWKRGLRRTHWVALASLALWAFLIYWQGDVTTERLALAARALVTLQWWAIPAPMDSLLIDLLLFSIGLALWTGFFAHYVLPVQSPGDSLGVLKQIARPLIGRRPAVLFVKDGEAQGAEAAPRVVLLDSASAAVLRNASAYTRAIGPGLNFLAPGERVARSLDLHKQRRSLGPLLEEDPFPPTLYDEDALNAESRQQRRRQTSGLTRDGVEVAPRIEVDFRLEGRSGGGGSPFGFHPEFAWRAAAHEGVDPQVPADARGHQVSWDWLPAYLAADLWREYLRKFSLVDLFSVQPAAEGETAQTGIEIIETMINRRLSESIVQEMDAQGRPVERQLSSPEYQILRERGVRLLGARLREVHLERARDEARLLSDWRDLWEGRARAAQHEGQKRVQEKRLLGEMDAAQEFLHTVSVRLYQRLKRTDGRIVRPPDAWETLGLLLEGSLSGVVQTPGVKAEVAEELRELAAWLQEQDIQEGDYEQA